MNNVISRSIATVPVEVYGNRCGEYFFPVFVFASCCPVYTEATRIITKTGFVFRNAGLRCPGVVLITALSQRSVCYGSAFRGIKRGCLLRRKQ